MDAQANQSGRGVEVSSVQPTASRAPVERVLTASEWKRAYTFAVIDLTALAGKWLRQNEPNDDIRDAVQQCADELIALTNSLHSQQRGLCSCGPQERCSQCSVSTWPDFNGVTFGAAAANRSSNP